MTKASDNDFPSILVTEQGSAPTTPAASHQRIYIRTSDHALVTVNSSGTVTAVGVAGNYTSAIPWSSGTSMPGGPATNQRITRTDLGRDFYYDGTRWLSVEIFREPIVGVGTENITASSATIGKMPMWHTDFDLWIVAMYAYTFVVTTNTGSAFWTVDLRKNDSAATATSLGTFTTAADAANAYVTHKLTVGAAVVQGTYKVLDVLVTKTSTPGALYTGNNVAYRIIGT